MQLGTVTALWRYPVKSLRGEQLERARFTERGLDGDRVCALRERATGRIVSGKRFEGVLDAQASTRRDDVFVLMPDGEEYPIADAALPLGDMLELDVDVVARDGGEERVEISGEEQHTFRGWPGSFFDSAPVHLVTTSTLRHLRALYPPSDFDVRRFRANVVIETPGDGPVEQSWIGTTLVIGDVRFEVLAGCDRCVMTTQAQDDLPKDTEILRTVARETDNIVGVLARVVREGECAAGDAVVV